MSFLAALGSMAAPLIKSAGGYLLGKAMPYIQRFGGAVRGLFNKGGQVGALGRSAADHFMERTINSGYGAAQKFASSDWVKRKMPMMAPHIGNAATALRDRLSGGYKDLLYGDKSQAQDGGYGDQGGSSGQDGVERYRQ